MPVPRWIPIRGNIPRAPVPRRALIRSVEVAIGLKEAPRRGSLRPGRGAAVMDLPGGTYLSLFSRRTDLNFPTFF
jgi:hypothetical protein